MTRPPRGVRNAVAIYLDMTLLVALLLLFSPRLTGLSLHEWLGISIGLPLIVHLLLSWSWIRAGTARFIMRSDARARVNYVLNWVLLVLMVIEVTSGIGISQMALPAMGIATINDRSWRALHNLALNWTLLVVGLHIAMNWRPLVEGVRRHLWSAPGPRE